MSKRRKERPRRDVLSFMAGLSLVSGNYRMAEGYVLELLACVAFSEWDETAMQAQAS